MANQHPSLTSSVIGTPVRAASGEEVGTVVDVVVHPTSGHVTYFVIGPSNEDNVLVVPWHLAKTRGPDRALILDMSADRLRSAPRFERHRFAQPGWEREAHAFYGYPRDWPVTPIADTPPHWPAERRASLAGPLVALVLLVLLVAAGYIVYRQGWTRTSNQVQTAAEAVRDTSADAATTAKVKAALALSKRVSALQVDVDTVDDVVTLEGRVPSEGVRQLAESIAADTAGVRDVRNALIVDSSVRNDPDPAYVGGAGAEADLQARIGESLRTDPALQGAQITLRVSNGVATLEGTVPTESQRARAEEVAASFPEITSVNNRLSTGVPDDQSQSR